MRTLTLLAPQIASSIENARLYEELAATRTAHGAGSEGRAPRAIDSASQGSAGNGRPRDRHRLASGARGQRRSLRLLRAERRTPSSIAFGDSSGKGAAAALYGSLVSGLLRSLAPRSERPSLLMKSLNQILLERKIDAQYVTLTLIYWNTRTRELRLSNAGAIPPMICRDGERVRVTAEGIPLGLLEDRDYDEVTVKTKKGDTIVLYSDGVADQLNRQDQEYGGARLFKAAESRGNTTRKTDTRGNCRRYRPTHGRRPDERRPVTHRRESDISSFASRTTRSEVTAFIQRWSIGHSRNRQGLHSTVSRTTRASVPVGPVPT